jgi:hypothetical protein
MISDDAPLASLAPAAAAELTARRARVGQDQGGRARTGKLYGVYLATAQSLRRSLGRWPTAQEIYDAMRAAGHECSAARARQLYVTALQRRDMVGPPPRRRADPTHSWRMTNCSRDKPNGSATDSSNDNNNDSDSGALEPTISTQSSLAVGPAESSKRRVVELGLQPPGGSPFDWFDMEDIKEAIAKELKSAGGSSPGAA